MLPPGPIRWYNRTWQSPRCEAKLQPKDLGQGIPSAEFFEGQGGRKRTKKKKEKKTNNDQSRTRINSRFSDYGQLKLPLVNFIRPGRQIVVNLDQIGDRETGGRAKGSDLLLTDPQIMTYPYERLSLHDNLSDPVSRKITDGKDIFGGGNVGSVFENLPQQHVCNAYCSWFNLPVMKGSNKD
ncbi:hypothetical protein C8R45DRAFT_937091 [Mycena sanguinolenta]|nr:hypothetical protein C8R45DRAFT_937091 [Mycena sanguinolenta]